jgi:hypothetical protein
MCIVRKIERLLTVLAIVCLSACGQIDDNLNDCPPPPPDEPVVPNEEYQLDYELKLVTNMTTELQTQLNTVTDIEISDALQEHLQGVFRGYAHDVDLSFYDTGADSLRLHHESHIMNDSLSSYTIFLPMREYMHVASANVLDNPLVSIVDDEFCHSIRLLQQTGDTINSHSTGVFTARSHMHVLEGIDQTFNVKLFMANAAATLLVDTTGVNCKDFKVYATGFATEFLMADSVYVFPEKSPYVRGEQLALSDSLNHVGFSVVSFPSRNPDGWWIREKEEVAFTRATGEIVPEGDGGDGEPLWEIVALVTLQDGSITQTTLTINEPLLGGELKIVRGNLTPEGVVQPKDVNVGCSFNVEWDPGYEFESQL